MSNRLSKKLISSVCAICILFSSAYVYGADNIRVKINDKHVRFNKDSGYPFIDENSRTQVPFRVVLESTGATVSWDDETKTAYAEKSDIKIAVPIGKSYITKNNKVIHNDTKSLIKDGRTYLPIRIVLENLGYYVDWFGDESTVIANNPIAIPDMPSVEVSSNVGNPRVNEPTVDIKGPNIPTVEDVKFIEDDRKVPIVTNAKDNSILVFDDKDIHSISNEKGKVEVIEGYNLGNKAFKKGYKYIVDDEQVVISTVKLNFKNTSRHNQLTFFVQSDSFDKDKGLGSLSVSEITGETNEVIIKPIELVDGNLRKFKVDIKNKSNITVYISINGAHSVKVLDMMANR